MKKLLLIAGFTFPSMLFAQEYYCPVNAFGGMQLKFDQWLTIQDSTVVFKINSQGKMETTTFRRIKPESQSVIYFTDGHTTSSLTFSETSGTLKGMVYSNTFTYKQNIQVEQTATLYCDKVPEK